MISELESFRPSILAAMNCPAHASLDAWPRNLGPVTDRIIARQQPVSGDHIPEVAQRMPGVLSAMNCPVTSNLMNWRPVL